MQTALYAGSFDPFTNGHLDIVRRGADLFDRVLVAVGHNPAKRALFTVQQRMESIEEACHRCGNVQVVSFSGLVMDAARQHHASFLLRGIRTAGDLELELRNGLANKDLAGLETVFLLSDPSNIFVSSSLVKEIFANGGDVSRYVPANVLAMLLVKRNEEV